MPRVGAGGFPLFSGNSFTFEMIEAIVFYNCPGVGTSCEMLRMLARKVFTKKKIYKASFYQLLLLAVRVPRLALSLHVICSKSWDILKDSLIAEHYITKH